MQQRAGVGEDIDGRIGLVVADAFAREDFREALQLIADGVRDIAGFDVAAVRVLRDTDDFEFIAVSGDDDARHTLLGRFTPREDVMADLEHADNWGRFRFLPAGRGWRTELTWVPAIDYPDSADAWHPENLLCAPLCDENGELIGLLGVDLPHDGRVPDAPRRAVLELYAAQAERVLARALRTLRQSEQLRLAHAARSLVRRAASSTDLRQLIAECQPVLLDAFRARGLIIEMFDDAGGANATRSIVGSIDDLPDSLSAITVRAAHLLWAAQEAGVVSGKRFTGSALTLAQRDAIFDVLSHHGRSSMMLAPLGAGTDCLGFVAFTRNPTDEVWTDVELEAAQALRQDLGRVVANARALAHDRQLVAKLQELDRYKGRLIATITHELKTPLTTITGHLELLEDREQLLDTMAANSLQALRRSAARLTTLVEDLLLLSRVSGAADAHLVEDVDLTALVEESVDLLAVQANARGISLTTHLAPSVVIEGAAAELQLLANNLVSNAVKYTPDGGVVEVTLEADLHRARLLVRDNGIGISPEDQQRLFEEFFRSADPAAHSRPGTGLGLAIAAKVVERARGTIHVESAPGAGSTFIATLPSGPMSKGNT